MREFSIWNLELYRKTLPQTLAEADGPMEVCGKVCEKANDEPGMLRIAGRRGPKLDGQLSAIRVWSTAHRALHTSCKPFAPSDTREIV